MDEEDGVTVQKVSSGHQVEILAYQEVWVGHLKDHTFISGTVIKHH